MPFFVAKLVVFVVYNLEKASKIGLGKLNKITTEAKSKGYKIIAMTASSTQEITAIQKEYGFDFKFYFCDETALKTIERANPTIMILKQGTIIQKLHYIDSDLLKL